MKLLIVTLLTLALGVWFGLLLHENTGMVVLTVGDWRVDAPLWLGVLVIALGYAILQIFLTLLQIFLHIPQKIRRLFAWIETRITQLWAQRKNREHLRQQAALAWQARLLSQPSLPELQATWRQIPFAHRRVSGVLSAYAQALIRYHQPETAEPLLRRAINRTWDPDWVLLYGQLNHPNTHALLIHAEKWLIAHVDSPELLLTLGRLCEKMQLWGKAEHYLEVSLSLKPLPQTYAQLGIVLEKMNKPELSAQSFKKGLLLSASTTSNST